MAGGGSKGKWKYCNSFKWKKKGNGNNLVLHLYCQVVYSKTASVPKVETVKSDNKDDDIDIDAI